MFNVFVKIILFLLISIKVCYAEPIKIGMEINAFPPYILGTKFSLPKERPGATVELLNQVAKNLHINFKFIRLPWTRILSDTKSGKIDAALGSSFKVERTLYGVYPLLNGKEDPRRGIGIRSYYLYQNKGQPLLWNGKKFSSSNRIFGVMKNYAIAKELRKNGLVIIEVDSQQQLFGMLKIGRLDGVIDLENFSDHLLKQSPDLATNVIKIYPPVREKAYHLMFSKTFTKNNRDLIEKIWNEIGRLRNSRDYEDLLESYLAGL
jgi:polar amino acid transport system substrate-binding protein